MNKSFIEINDNSPILSRKGMNLKIFKSDYRLIKYMTMTITKHAPECLKNINLLKQQISELIKNGAKHGNKYDPEKEIKIWFKFTSDSAHIIVEDEGDGFKELEKWNQLKQLRDIAFRSRDFEKMAKYALWKGKNSTPDDGGNAMFAAVEYWNQGVVYSSRRNCVGVKKVFPNNGCNCLLAIS